MNIEKNYIDTDLSRFAEDVIEASHQQLVMVDFWAEWCGPCQSLGPILEGLVEKYQGKVKLVKVDADKHQELAGQLAIQSLPTVFFFKDGQPVDQFMGAQTEQAIREIIDRHTGDEMEMTLQKIQAIYDEGQTDEAKAYLAQIIENQIKDDRVILLLLKFLTAEGGLEQASTLVEAISDEGKNSVEYKAYLTSKEFQDKWGDLPELSEIRRKLEQDKENLPLRFQLAQKLVVGGEVEAGLEELLKIVAKDKTFDDGAARLLMIKVFESLGGQGEVVSKYRSRLARLLY